nr:MAG TPA: hypothetical protein [Caudoviricetes sp.]
MIRPSERFQTAFVYRAAIPSGICRIRSNSEPPF